VTTTQKPFHFTRQWLCVNAQRTLAHLQVQSLACYEVKKEGFSGGEQQQGAVKRSGVCARVFRAAVRATQRPQSHQASSRCSIAHTARRLLPALLLPLCAPPVSFIRLSIKPKAKRDSQMQCMHRAAFWLKMNGERLNGGRDCLVGRGQGQGREEGNAPTSHPPSTTLTKR